MAKYVVELFLDSYDSEEEHDKACEEFIYDQLNHAGSCVNITKFGEVGSTEAIKMLKELGIRYEFKSDGDDYQIKFYVTDDPVIWQCSRYLRENETIWTRIIDFINESKEDKNSWLYRNNSNKFNHNFVDFVVKRIRRSGSFCLTCHVQTRRLSEDKINDLIDYLKSKYNINTEMVIAGHKRWLKVIQ